MFKNIALVAVAFILSAIAFTSSASADDMKKCTEHTSVAQFRIVWKGNGKCDGWVSAQDFADIAKVAAADKMGMVLKVSMYIPTKCHGEGEYAIISVSKFGNTLYPNGWSKIGCNERGYQSVAELNPRVAGLF